MPYILGVSFDYHDAAAALITDDEIIAAAQEERFSRKKNDPDLPLRAIQFCCKQAGISAERLDHVIYYENALLKLERIIKSFSVSPSWEKRRYFEKTLNSWLLKTKYSPVDKLADALSLPRHKISYLHHHQAHAASAFYCSPYDEGTVITLDGVGEFETMTISHGKGNDLNQLASVSFPHSVGLFYSAITAFLGFRVNEDE